MLVRMLVETGVGLWLNAGVTGLSSRSSAITAVNAASSFSSVCPATEASRPSRLGSLLWRPRSYTRTETPATSYTNPLSIRTLTNRQPHNLQTFWKYSPTKSHSKRTCIVERSKVNINISYTRNCRPTKQLTGSHKNLRRGEHGNPLECRGNYSATSNNTKLVHWPLMGACYI